MAKKGFVKNLECQTLAMFVVSETQAWRIMDIVLWFYEARNIRWPAEMVGLVRG